MGGKYNSQLDVTAVLLQVAYKPRQFDISF